MKKGLQPWHNGCMSTLIRLFLLEPVSVWNRAFRISEGQMDWGPAWIKASPARPMARTWDSVDPNKGHLAVLELQKLGKLKFLISQNVDNLHLKSVIRPELLAELHGNITNRRCTRWKKCSFPTDRGLH
ncbi:MAG: Sir2 family NAD-dependent protein deacetylase [Thermodesulfobacteriota bacterium]|nr:Sir2 family NAD-dependent protein deacetylase [Thermodesulfobacteriota bacterium]